jgi:hypothetical protein
MIDMVCKPFLFLVERLKTAIKNNNYINLDMVVHPSTWEVKGGKSRI